MTWGIRTCKKTTSSSIRRVCRFQYHILIQTICACLFFVSDKYRRSLDFSDTNPRTKPSNTSTTYPPQNNSAPAPASGKNPFSTKRYLWSLSFYSQFFDVDTSEVLRRCQAAIFPRANFLDVLDGNPDLYGPFWIATTVVVILFFTGTISRYLKHQGDAYFSYDFTLLTGMRLEISYAGFGVFGWELLTETS